MPQIVVLWEKSVAKVKEIALLMTSVCLDLDVGQIIAVSKFHHGVVQLIVVTYRVIYHREIYTNLIKI